MCIVNGFVDLRDVLGSHGADSVIGEIQLDNILVATQGHRHRFRALSSQAVVTVTTFLRVNLSDLINIQFYFT